VKRRKSVSDQRSRSTGHPRRPRAGQCPLRARAISEAEGVDAFQALQRVLYRSAKQDPQRRFHALYDKLTRRDVMWRAWVNVATNRGAASRRDRRALFSSASSIACDSRRNGEVVGISTAGHRHGPWIQLEPRSERERPVVGQACRSICCRGTQPRFAGMGELLPLRQLVTEVRHYRQLRSSADGHACQRQVWAPRSELVHPLHLWVDDRPGDLSSRREGALWVCGCLTVNDVGEPDEWRTSCPDR
jgi:hypothetical protein